MDRREVHIIDSADFSESSQDFDLDLRQCVEKSTQMDIRFTTFENRFKKFTKEYLQVCKQAQEDRNLIKV